MILIIAALLLIILGVVHSWLGEKYVLIRLFRKTDIPKLYGSDRFTKATLRFAWHLTTLAWWGFAAVLFALARAASTTVILYSLAMTFFLSGVLSAGFTKGKHISWIFFWIVAGLILAAS